MISLSLFSFMHWRRKWQPTPVFLPGESQGRESLVGCRLWGRTELDTTEATEQQQQQQQRDTSGLCQIHPLHLSCQFPIQCNGSSITESACNAGDTGDTSSIPESRKSPGGEMATHARIFAWNILWTEELGGLQSTGSQRVGRD